MHINSCYFEDYIESLLSSYILRTKIITDKQKKKRTLYFSSWFLLEWTGVKMTCFCNFFFLAKTSLKGSQLNLKY